MKTQNIKPQISEYSFLRLYILTMLIQKQCPIIDNHLLEKKLYNLYNKPDYLFLFEDIIKKEDRFFPENNHVDLSMAFQTAYTWGMLTMIQDNNGIRSIINFPQEKALEEISQYTSEQVNAMNNLCIEINESKKEKKSNSLIKKINSNTPVY